MIPALARMSGADRPLPPEPTAPRVARGNFDLFLLMGQSNMAGRACVEAGDRLPQPRVVVLGADGQWISRGEPVHFDKPRTVGLGPALSFGKTVAAADSGKTIGLIPCAVGNTPLERWEKGGDLYDAAIRRWRAASSSGILRAILWHQGESDSNGEQEAKSYGKRLARMVTDLRVDLQSGDVPFLAGQLGDFLIPRSDGEFPHAEIVNEGIRRLPEYVPQAFAVPAANLGHRGDTVHFDGPAVRELGHRYAEAYLALVRGHSR
ncbi:MAG TPA: sialate O-acetylesterase [Terrimicrobiaceae bacterium]|nr:sialate O-acetylesterase [Terrimicrobiaceae bacterium]